MKPLNLAMEVLFWLSLGLVVHTYFIYPVVLFVGYFLAQVRTDWRYLFGRRDRRVLELSDDELPKISFLIPAYNEETHLLEKIENLRQLEYPREKLQIVFVSDGSTDATNEILTSLPDANIETIILPNRSGKATGLNRAVSRARHEILVFSDASTLFAPDALRKLVRHFVDPQVGAVCGALQFKSSEASRQTEGVYWKYECVLRLMEARLSATLTASGAVYALRREAYVTLDPNTLLDDFIIPMNARKAGFHVRYDPEATATDFAPDSIEGEFTRRVRLATGSFQSLIFLLRVQMGGFCRFAFISHKLCRWILPVLLCVLLISNLVLLGYTPFYSVIGLAQLSFYVWAGLGFVFRERLQGVRFALLAYFLLAMNLALMLGMFRWLRNQQEATWQRVN